MQTELKNCPFCGCTMRVEDNLVTYKLRGDHDDDCVFESDDDALTGAVHKGSCEWLYTTWNRRAGSDAPSAADYEAVIADCQRLVRELDVLLNGENAAKQASLCDIVAQVAAMKQAIHDAADGKRPAVEAYRMLPNEIARLADMVTNFKSLEAELSEQEQSAGSDARATLPLKVDAFIYSQNLYSLLTDIQNGIDSPATMSFANQLICQLDDVHAALVAAPVPPAGEKQPEEWTWDVADEVMAQAMPAPAAEELPELPVECVAWAKAERARIAAVDALNARWRQSQELPFPGLSLEAEDQAMNEARRKANSLLLPMLEAIEARAALEKREFWPVVDVDKTSRRQLADRIGQMNFTLTHYRKELDAARDKIKRQAEQLGQLQQALAARKPVEVDEEAERRGFASYATKGRGLTADQVRNVIDWNAMEWRAWKARAALATAAEDEKPVGQIRDDVERCRAIWFDGGRLKHGDMLYTRPDPARLAEAAKVVADNLPFIANSVASYMPGHACQGFAVEISQQVDLLRKALREYEAGKLT